VDSYSKRRENRDHAQPEAKSELPVAVLVLALVLVFDPVLLITHPEFALESELLNEVASASDFRGCRSGIALDI